jgi:hypothetical protein
VSARRQRSQAKKAPPRLGGAIFLVFFGLFLLLTGREPVRGDAVPMWEVAENLVRNGSVAIQTQWNVERGHDGRIYALLPLFTSLVHVPGAAARDLVEWLVPGTADLTLPLASKLAPAFLAALTCALFFALARRFVDVTTATLTTLAVGFGTAVAVYSRTPYTEILQTCCFTGFVLAVAEALESPTARSARRAAFWLGLLLNAKLIFALSVPGVAALFIWRLRKNPRHLVTFFTWAAIVLAVMAVPILWYNAVRWGHPLATGYGSSGRGVLWRGLWGLLFSPGKSVFIYNPPLVVALFGLPALFRQNRLFVMALVLAIVPVVLYYAQFMYWDGDWAWGPRYLTFAMPALCVALAPVIEAARQQLRLLRSAVLAAALAAGIWVQTLGSIFYWDHWIQITIAATHEWLRYPHCPPPLPPERGCWPDGKILYAMHWVPALQQLAGHVWLMRHVPFGDPFEVAELDAPWQWQRTVHVPGAKTHYNNAGIDWWALDFRPYPNAARGIAAVMFLHVVAGGVLWRRRLEAK